MVPITLSGSGIDGSTVAGTVLYQSLNITSTLPAYFFGANASSLISKFIPSDTFSELALSVASAASAESVPGANDPTSLVYSALEGTSLPSSFRYAIPAAYSTQMATLEAQISTLRAVLSVPTATGPTTSDPTSPDPTTSATTEPPSRASSPPSSRAWIAGAVIGPVFGICLILFGALILRHRKLAKVRKDSGTTYDAENKTHDKPQLHSDCLQPPQRVVYELGGRHDSVELEVSEAPHELPAEVPGERPTSESKGPVAE
ncbi:hypothetical protein VPNG_09671 [Cytospora leucostoma]|uniref:Uncharacterized protein n=1 Tax=Cytospora leucostoma TaxID=1230097 RepID=A0A423VMI6_9PEZI|nr:hypothetical protein VPNG_09671 [Cytospora leucostoma]